MRGAAFVVLPFAAALVVVALRAVRLGLADFAAGLGAAALAFAPVAVAWVALLVFEPAFVTCALAEDLDVRGAAFGVLPFAAALVAVALCAVRLGLADFAAGFGAAALPAAPVAVARAALVGFERAFVTFALAEDLGVRGAAFALSSFAAALVVVALRAVRLGLADFAAGCGFAALASEPVAVVWAALLGFERAFVAFALAEAPELRGAAFVVLPFAAALVVEALRAVRLGLVLLRAAALVDDEARERDAEAAGSASGVPSPEALSSSAGDSLVDASYRAGDMPKLSGIECTDAGPIPADVGCERLQPGGRILRWAWTGSLTPTCRHALRARGGAIRPNCRDSC